jgi:protein SCO1/2
MRPSAVGLIFTIALLAPAQRGECQAYRGGLVTPPIPKPRLILTDTSGAAFDVWNRTQWVVTLLFFGYTNCPDQCPMHMSNIGTALKRLPPDVVDQVKLLFVTTDPARDSPAALRGWLDAFDRRFIGLTGTDAALEVMQRAVGVFPARKGEVRNQSYAVAHANFVAAFTKDNLAHVIYPGGITSDDWAHDLPQLVKETWTRTERVPATPGR